MRLRNVKGSREMIATNDFVVHEEETMKGKWHAFFGNENPIHIEVGMGKGRFIIGRGKKDEITKRKRLQRNDCHK